MGLLKQIGTHLFNLKLAFFFPPFSGNEYIFFFVPAGYDHFLVDFVPCRTSAALDAIPCRIAAALDVKVCRISAALYVKPCRISATLDVKACRISTALDVKPCRFSASLEAILCRISAALDIIPWQIKLKKKHHIFHKSIYHGNCYFRKHKIVWKAFSWTTLKFYQKSRYQSKCQIILIGHDPFLATFRKCLHLGHAFKAHVMPSVTLVNYNYVRDKIHTLGIKSYFWNKIHTFHIKLISEKVSENNIINSVFNVRILSSVKCEWCK